MKTDKWYFLMILPALAFICFFIFYPLFQGGVMAFQNYSLFNLKDIRFIGLDNFRTIITSKSVNFWLAQLGLQFLALSWVRQHFGVLLLLWLETHIQHFKPFSCFLFISC